MKYKEDGGIPLNARINIRYTNDKPIIRFSFPDKKNQVRGDMSMPFRFLLLIWSVIVIGNFPLKIAITNPLFILKPITVLLYPFFIYYLGFLIYFIPPLRKGLEKLYPKYQATFSLKKIAVFYPKDVKIENDRIYCELPVFNNVVCDFKCIGDFSEYLNEIDIREHKFTYLRFRMKIIRRKNKKVKKRKVNEFMWYARWYFDQPIKKGKMTVIFK